MPNCLNCNKETQNPKFCSRSCSASFINIGNRRWGAQPTNCIVCGGKNLKHTSKYCSHKCFREDTFNKKLIEWKQTGKIDNRDLRKYLIKKFDNTCQCCKISEWNGLPLSLEVEHIDGDGYNHNEDNLTLLCPNCHSQTPTYKGRNYGNGRTIRKKKLMSSNG